MPDAAGRPVTDVGVSGLGTAVPSNRTNRPLLFLRRPRGESQSGNQPVAGWSPVEFVAGGRKQAVVPAVDFFLIDAGSVWPVEGERDGGGNRVRRWAVSPTDRVTFESRREVLGFLRESRNLRGIAVGRCGVR